MCELTARAGVDQLRRRPCLARLSTDPEKNVAVGHPFRHFGIPRHIGDSRGRPWWRLGPTPKKAASAGLRADGTPYVAISRRRCQCLDCGQVRIDKAYA